MGKMHMAAAAAVGVLGGVAFGDIINVPGDQPTIQAGIDAAQNGDEVVVAPGTYNEAINFQGDAITLRSSGGPDVTIIDATGLSDRVVRCILGEGPDTVLQGFTLTGGDAGFGGGMWNVNSSPTIRGCRFVGNSAIHAAGMYNDGSSPTVTNCTFSGNTALSDGGGMYNANNSNPVVTNCTFSGNTAASIGGGMYNLSGSSTVTNCTFSGNSSADGGGMANVSNLSVVNSVVWGNNGGSFGGPQAPVVSYSNIQGGWPGPGNVNVDPLLVDPANDDYRLSPGSPCIDAGLNSALPEGITTDLDDNPRFVDDPGTPDCQQAPGTCGDPPVVDMGAYEFQGASCPWDLNGDGDVTTTDLLTLLALWGTDPGGPPDLDGDGNVGTTDLLMLLANWGSCD